MSMQQHSIAPNFISFVQVPRYGSCVDNILYRKLWLATTRTWHPRCDTTGFESPWFSERVPRHCRYYLLRGRRFCHLRHVVFAESLLHQFHLFLCGFQGAFFGSAQRNDMQVHRVESMSSSSHTHSNAEATRIQERTWHLIHGASAHAWMPSPYTQDRFRKVQV